MDGVDDAAPEVVAAERLRDNVPTDSRIPIEIRERNEGWAHRSVSDENESLSRPRQRHVHAILHGQKADGAVRVRASSYEHDDVSLGALKVEMSKLPENFRRSELHKIATLT